jgi:hypothetical protein
VVVHRGAYAGLPEAHATLHAWCAANGRTIGGYSLEIYGDWSRPEQATDDDPIFAALARVVPAGRAISGTGRGGGIDAE